MKFSANGSWKFTEFFIDAPPAIDPSIEGNFGGASRGGNLLDFSKVDLYNFSASYLLNNTWDLSAYSL